MRFSVDGAERHAKALSDDELALLRTLMARRLTGGPGTRLTGDETLSRLLEPGGSMDSLAKSGLGDKARPVRALLFDKRAGRNWALGWHQDRTIAVRARSDTPGFGPWSRKAGIDHVEPPFDYIAGMVTLRAHLDACDQDNAPLLIVPGSHRLGRIPQDQVAELAARMGSFACVAEAGDVWLYATAIVHASDAARNPRRRRVLQVDYSAASLPGDLDWLGL